MKYFKSTSFRLLLAISIIFFTARFFIFQNEIKQIKELYIDEKQIAANDVASTIHEKLKLSYETLRTISMLPDVRSLKHEGEVLPKSSSYAVQQLYNNIFDNIQLSEIYILSKDFNYKNISPITKRAEAPIVVFDEFITNPNDKKNKVEENTKDKIEEVEIYEYALHVKQLTFLEKQYPNNKAFSRLEVPLISGPEVITCDNTDFTKKDLQENNNAPRNGIVLTVPRYDLDGQFNGGISAVIRTKILQSMLPDGSYGLINMQNKNQINKAPTKDWNNSVTYFKKGQTNPNLIFSKIVPIKTMDQSPWVLWVALPDSEFYNSDNYRNAVRHFIMEMIWGILIILSIFLLQKRLAKNENELKSKNALLDAQKEKLKKSNLLLQVLSHDVSNTLMVIKSGVQLIKKFDTKLDDPVFVTKRKNTLDKTLIAAEIAIGVLDHVKELKAIESGRLSLPLQPTSLDNVFEIASILFEDNLKVKNISLKLENKNPDQLFLCHKTSFSNSVFNNLISNAIKFSPKDSEIIIRTELHDKQFKIFIQDFGIGIPKELSGKLFESNQSISRQGTSGEKGTGFGLSLAKSYVENYGRSLSFTSRTIGQTGTTFEIALNLAS